MDLLCFRLNNTQGQLQQGTGLLGSAADTTDGAKQCAMFPLISIRPPSAVTP